MTRFLEFPDIEAVCATALRNASIPLVTGVYSSIPTEPVYPLITVERTGGDPAVREYLDAASIQISVWGASKSQARDIAAHARIILLEMEGAFTSFNAFVSGVADGRGLTWQPD